MLNAQTSSDTCAGTDSETAITSSGLYNVSAIDGSEFPNPLCTDGPDASAGEWFKYIPTEDTYVTITTDLDQNSGGDTRFHVYSGTCGALVCEGGDDDGGFIGNGYLSITSLSVTANQTYYIAFDNRWNSDGFDFEVIEGGTPPLTPPVTFTTQSISTTGTNRAVVDMNADFLDDIVSINATNINIQYQLIGGGFQEVNITTSEADFTPGWSLAAADFDGNGYTDLLYGSGSGVTFMKANSDGTAYTEISGPEYVFSQRSNFADIDNHGHLDAFVCRDVQPNVY